MPWWEIILWSLYTLLWLCILVSVSTALVLDHILDPKRIAKLAGAIHATREYLRRQEVKDNTFQ